MGSTEWGAVHNDGDHTAPPTSAVALEPTRRIVRHNRLSGSCEGCGDPVRAGQGEERSDGSILCAGCSWGSS